MNTKYLTLIVLLFSVSYSYSQVGIKTVTPNSSFEVNGSFTKSYTTTPETGTVFNLDETHYTVRVFGFELETVNLPDPTTCQGRVYVIIGSNTILPKNITVTGCTLIYDDVTNTNITSINANERFKVQSDGTNWIVIGR